MFSTGDRDVGKTDLVKHSIPVEETLSLFDFHLIAWGHRRKQRLKNKLVTC